MEMYADYSALFRKDNGLHHAFLDDSQRNLVSHVTMEEEAVSITPQSLVITLQDRHRLIAIT